MTVARVEVITDEHRCGIDPLTVSSAVIGRCSQCALVSVDRATVSRAREKCRPHPTMDRAPSDARAVGCRATSYDRVRALASLRTTFFGRTEDAAALLEP